MRVFLSWVVERSLEVVLVTAFIHAKFYEPTRFELFEIVETSSKFALFPALFYVMSGYIFSCVYFGLVRRRPDAFEHVKMMMIAYTAHAFFFLAISSSEIESLTFEIAGVGLLVVTVSSLIGAQIAKTPAH